MGVEPTVAAERRRPPVLKTGTITGPHALPRYSNCLNLLYVPFDSADQVATLRIKLKHVKIRSMKTPSQLQKGSITLIAGVWYVGERRPKSWALPAIAFQVLRAQDPKPCVVSIDRIFAFGTGVA